MRHRKEEAMFTRAEKGYLALTLFFLAAGSGIKAYRNTTVRLGPFPDPAFASERTPVPHQDSASAGNGIDSALPVPDDRFSGVIDSSKNVHGSGDSGSVRVYPEATGSMPSLGKDAGRRPANRSGKTAFAGKVDLNKAGIRELTQVKGLGEKTAKAILEYRKAHGLFRELRDLLQVKGIGEKKLEKLTPFLIL
jgi:comEA protein